eukprot:11791635-Heterocapsa_arctica.AAC.1
MLQRLVPEDRAVRQRLHDRAPGLQQHLRDRRYHRYCYRYCCCYFCYCYYYYYYYYYYYD